MTSSGIDKNAFLEAKYLRIYKHCNLRKSKKNEYTNTAIYVNL